MEGAAMAGWICAEAASKTQAEPGRQASGRAVIARGRTTSLGSSFCRGRAAPPPLLPAALPLSSSPPEPASRALCSRASAGLSHPPELLSFSSSPHPHLLFLSSARAHFGHGRWVEPGEIEREMQNYRYSGSEALPGVSLQCQHFKARWPFEDDRGLVNT
ncbi:hypothetical protein BRADI_4g14495v3 [Brachypodium distachyon]|uniref:Uncharacterized protein n=1 Tax=Brachypodium distachyon TaxID=15368 RepID=A0A0Q3ENV5_BRADI|nr:hypothetical protein BRADI_4g14495v3 [Brachypodium distachyon]